MIHVREIDHIVLRVRDLGAMLKFYCEVLGLSIERRQDAIGLIQLRAGRSLIDLIPIDGLLGRQGGAGPGAEGRNLDHFCLRLEPFDCEGILSYLKERGIQVGDVGTGTAPKAMDPQFTSATRRTTPSSWVHPRIRLRLKASEPVLDGPVSERDGRQKASNNRSPRTAGKTSRRRRPHRVHLVHWHPGEAEERAARLRSAGFLVSHETMTPAVLRSMRSDPPDAIVIDLSRIPSQGRDVGLSIRMQKDTRRIPLVFVDGEREKIAQIRRLLPDAQCTTWNRIRTALENALARPLLQPVVPESSLTGYSGTPLVKKLGIKPHSRVILLGPPDGFENTLGVLPEGVTMRRRASERSDLIIWFVRTLSELEHRIGRIFILTGEARLWIAWPKKTSSLAGDLSQTEVRNSGLAAGLVDYKVCAIDETWSGLLFVRRKIIRS
jgi:catechol 2,3-dioxygenase-like lactoylglutathione lyase family enzyme